MKTDNTDDKTCLKGTYMGTISVDSSWLIDENATNITYFKPF